MREGSRIPDSAQNFKAPDTKPTKPIPIDTKKAAGQKTKSDQWREAYDEVFNAPPEKILQLAANLYAKLTGKELPAFLKQAQEKLDKAALELPEVLMSGPHKSTQEIYRKFFHEEYRQVQLQLMGGEQPSGQATEEQTDARELRAKNDFIREVLRSTGGY